MLTYRLQRPIQFNMRFHIGISTFLNRKYGRVLPSDRWFNIRTERNLYYLDDSMGSVIRVDVYTVFNRVNTDSYFDLEYKLPC